MTDDPNDQVMLSGYLDGEMSAADTRAFEQRLAVEPELAASLETLRALRSAIRRMPRQAMSEALSARLSRIGTPAPRRPSFDRRFDWRALAATAVVACGVGALVTQFSLRDANLSAANSEIVSAHQHALLATDPVEVASSDRHTVKPWFDAQLAISPPVIDLGSQGYVLAGGRIETVRGRRVPVLIYRSNRHLISVVAVPDAGGRDDKKPPLRTSRDGYTVLAWRGPDFDFYAVSDVFEADLTNFVQALRSASRN